MNFWLAQSQLIAILLNRPTCRLPDRRGHRGLQNPSDRTSGPSEIQCDFHMGSSVPVQLPRKRHLSRCSSYARDRADGVGRSGGQLCDFPTGVGAWRKQTETGTREHEERPKVFEALKCARSRQMVVSPVSSLFV